MFCTHGSFIRHLEAELVWHRDQLIHERQRAELALDELLRLRVGAGPVTMPTPQEAKAQESEMDKLLRSSEFTAAGRLEDTE